MADVEISVALVNARLERIEHTKVEEAVVAEGRAEVVDRVRPGVVGVQLQAGPAQCGGADADVETVIGREAAVPASVQVGILEIQPGETESRRIAEQQITAPGP